MANHLDYFIPTISRALDHAQPADDIHRVLLKIDPTLAAAKVNLTAVSISMEHIKELEGDLKPDGRLCMVNLKW